jgi:hypothetical protein
MNLHLIFEKTRALYEADNSNRKALRISRIAKRLIKVRKNRLKGKTDIVNPRYVSQEALDRRVADLRAHVEGGSVILALDAEWTQDRHITEIGFAIYQNGVTRHRNIRILPDPYSHDPFRFGTTEFMSEAEAVEEIFVEQLRADLIVGHDLINDRRQFAKIGASFHETTFDTMKYGRFAHPGELVKLKTMVHRAGFKAMGSHNAGNDAAMTLHVALALVGRHADCVGAELHHEGPRSFPINPVQKA